MALAGLLSLILGWWASPIDHAAGFGAMVGGLESRFFLVLLGARGIAPIGYAAFAFVLGVLIGLMVRPGLGLLLVGPLPPVLRAAWAGKCLLAPLPSRYGPPSARRPVPGRGRRSSTVLLHWPGA